MQSFERQIGGDGGVQDERRKRYFLECLKIGVK